VLLVLLAALGLGLKLLPPILLRSAAAAISTAAAAPPPAQALRRHDAQAVLLCLQALQLSAARRSWRKSRLSADTHAMHASSRLLDCCGVIP
jgi:hypothetical protein